MKRFLEHFSSRFSPIKLFLTSATITSILFWDPSLKKGRKDEETELAEPTNPLYVEAQCIAPSNQSSDEIQLDTISDFPLEKVQALLPEQHILTDSLVAQLMAIADRFVCATEMATFIAIMNVGGPRHLLYQDSEWDASTRRTAERVHTALAKGCADELEFALKLYTAWSETEYAGQLLAPAWALRQAWHPRRIPALTAEMKEHLGTHTAQFGRKVGEVFDDESIEQIVDDYHLADVAAAWLKETKYALRETQQEAWATAFFVHHGLLKYKVQPARDKLLDDLEVNKKEKEARPINFDMLDKLRILLAYSFVSQASSYQSMPSSLVKIKPEWEAWLQQPDHTPIDLTRFIIEQTRKEEEAVTSFAYSRLFLDQRAPLGTRYACHVIESTADRPVQVELIRRLHTTRVRQESFMGETRTGQLARIRTADEVRREDTNTRLAVAQWPNTLTGYLYETDTAYQVGDLLNVEIVDYNFDNPSFPRTVVQPVPDLTAFYAFTERYQLGDLVTVVVRAYDERPGDPRIALVVREEESRLELLLEAEQLSFTPLGQAIKQIPLGTALQVVVDDIDEEQKKISLSLLSRVEAHLNTMLQGRKRGDGTYYIEAIIADVHEENFSLILQGSDPSLGRIYAAQMPTLTLPEPRSAYQPGQAVILRLTFPGESFTEDMQKLPTEVKKVIDLQQGFQHLFWDAPQLHFYGRMSYSTRNKLLALSTDHAYQQAIRQLYLLSQQFTLEVVTIKTQGPTEQLTLAEEMEQETIPTDALYPEGEPEDDAVVATYRREILRTLPQVSTFATRYQIGDRVRGWVTGVLDYGAFVEFPSGLKGLVHKSKMWGYVADARDVIRAGEELEVIILDVRPHGNLELSLRIPENDPLLKYEVGDKVKGMVINIQEHGALIEIEPDVRGLVHKSKMWGYVPHVEDVVHYGEEVTVLILSIDQEKRRLELSMQVAEHDRLQYYQAGDLVVGTVTEVMDYGAFVEIEPGVSGLVYRDDLPGYVTDARKMLSKGDEVEVLIIRVDRVKRHLSLSMRDI